MHVPLAHQHTFGGEHKIPRRKKTFRDFKCKRIHILSLLTQVPSRIHRHTSTVVTITAYTATGLFLSRFIPMSPTDVKRSQAKSIWRMEVDSGGCFIGDELIRCSLDKTHCQGLEFRSSRQMLLSLRDRECMKPNSNFVGMCTSPIGE